MSKQGISDLPSIPWNRLMDAARVTDRAAGLTHSLYRYPASMSPALVRTLILGLTNPGETVLDPFCGGGTTAIEALAHGRSAICSDINALACFVTRAKATCLSSIALREYRKWAEAMCRVLQSDSGRARLMRRHSVNSPWSPQTQALLLAVRNSADQLSPEPARRFATLVLLRAAQVCFDRSLSPLRPTKLARAFVQLATQAGTRMQEYRQACDDTATARPHAPSLRVINCDAAEVSARLPSFNGPISLVLTSPPYPGVHMLYHRWQIHGRRETNLPYTVIGEPDGRFESAYTLGSRADPDNASYFSRLETIYTNLHAIIQPTTLVAQAVAFARPRVQLAKLRNAMENAGFEEIRAPRLGGRPLTRAIPNRRWYALLSENQNAAKEYLLIYRPNS